MSNVHTTPWEIEKIIYVAKQLAAEGCSSGSTVSANKSTY